MKPETQGKLMVAMTISILAFGLGTGTVLLTGHYQYLDTPTTLNNSTQSDFPVISNNQNSISTSNNQSSENTQSSTNNPSTNNNNNNPTNTNNNNNPTDDNSNPSNDNSTE